MFMIRIFFLLISIIFISQNLYALEKEMGKIKPEVVIACKEIKNGVESKEVLFKRPISLFKYTREKGEISRDGGQTSIQPKRWMQREKMSN